jgi:hypothetical protein
MSKIPLIIAVGADKGGVGKTMTTRALSDFCQQRHTGAKLYDGETGAGDLMRFTSADVVDLSKVSDQMKIFDDLAGVTVIDIRAGMLSPTLRALDQAHLLDDVRGGTLRLAVVHVIGPSFSSLREIEETAAALGGAKHFLVQNDLRSDGGFSEWQTDTRFAGKLASMEARTISIPHLNAEAADALQKIGGSFVAFSKDSAQSRILRGYVKSWLDTVWRGFDRVGLGDMIASAVG